MIKYSRAYQPGKLIFVISFVLLAFHGTAFTGELPLMKIQEVTDLIMSPGCDYLYTLSKCPSAEAAQMREMVKDKLLQGESQEQILSYFEQVYGPRVLARPAKRGFYFVAWWFPYFILADAFVLVGVVLYIWRRRARNIEGSDKQGQGVNSPIDAELDSALEAEVRKVKES
jgi:cytochrome c-type biogenesis protein CcmH/NrfF